MRKDWLREVHEPMFDAAMLRAMDEQLRGVFASLTGEDIGDFVLVPPPGERFEVVLEADGGHLSGELLNIDVAVPVTIGWTASEGEEKQFRWLELPHEDIRAFLADRRAISIRTRAPIAVEVNNPVWPHLSITLYLRTTTSEAELERQIASVVGAWADRAGAFHNARVLTAIDPRTYTVFVDFGSTGAEALEYLLDELNERVPIEKVTLDS